METQYTFTIRYEYDSDPDLSYYGTYTNNADAPGAIARDRIGRHEYTHFIPQITEDAHFTSLRAMMHGSKHAYSVKRARELARSYVQQDYERMEAYNNDQWSVLGCIVAFKVNNIIISESSLWGIESDTDKPKLSRIESDLCYEAYQEGFKQIAYFTSLAIPELETIERIKRD